MKKILIASASAGLLALGTAHASWLSNNNNSDSSKDAASSAQTAPSGKTSLQVQGGQHSAGLNSHHASQVQLGSTQPSASGHKGEFASHKISTGKLHDQGALDHPTAMHSQHAKAAHSMRTGASNEHAKAAAHLSQAQDKMQKTADSAHDQMSSAMKTKSQDAKAES